MPRNRPSRHGKRRIPDRDADFDQYIRNVTAYLLSESPSPPPEKKTMLFEDGEEMLFEDGEKMEDEG